MLDNREIDRVFHALAEPTRRAIVERLTAGPSTVSDLARPFDMTLAAIVQHLQVLEESGLVRLGDFLASPAPTPSSSRRKRTLPRKKPSP